MTIGVLTTSYPKSNEDPAGHFVRGFAEWLATNVGPVEVVALDAPSDPALRLRRGGLPDRLHGARGALTALALGGRLANAARRRARHWDAIVSHWLAPSGLIADVISQGRPHLAIAHGSDVELLRRLPGGRAFVRHLARRADLVYVAPSLQIAGARGRVVAMPPAEAVSARTDEERRHARAALALAPLGEGPLVLLFVGRFIDDKGVDLLVDALPEGAQLLIAGEGPQPPRPHPRVRLLGPRFGADLRTAYAAADLLVVPSRRDGAPTVVAEAQATGLPVIGAAVGGIPVAIGHDCTFAPDVASLRRKITEAIALRGGYPVPQSVAGWSTVGPQLWRSALPARGVIAEKITTFFC